MAKSFIPHMCGGDGIHIPDKECTDCELLEIRVQELEDTRLVQEDIIAGDNIEVEYEENNNNVIISAKNVYSKAEVDAIIDALETGGYEIVNDLPSEGNPKMIYLVPLGNDVYERWIYTNDEWVSLGTTNITLDKQTILNALGYEESDISMTDTNNSTVTITVLTKITQ